MSQRIEALIGNAILEDAERLRDLLDVIVKKGEGR
jgi:23S rRNA maturation mini-RNase III